MNMCVNLKESLKKAPQMSTCLTGFLLAAYLIFTGCAGRNGLEQKVTPVSEQETETTTSDEALVELTEIVLPQKADVTSQKTQKLYTLQMREAEIQDILLAFSEQTDLNIIVEPDISGKVTVDLKKVSLKQALDIIILPLGLDYKMNGNLIKVFKSSIESRIFHIDYITTIRTGRGRVSGSIGGRDNEDGEGGTQEGSGSGGFSEVASSVNTDMWEELSTGLDSLKSTDGKIIVNKTANTVVALDYPLNIERIAGFLDAVQGSIQRQVIIEASIMEVTLSDRCAVGINWGYIQNLPQMSNLSWGLSRRGGSDWVGYPGSTGDDEGSGGEGDTMEIPGKIILRPFSGVFRIGADGQTILLTDIVEALSTQGDVDMLSNPRVSTLNNQPAIIKVAREDVYFQTIRSTNFGESTTESNVNFLTVGIVLSVTPQISSDGVITMTIHPSITEKMGEKTSALGDSVPILDVRETETVARVRDSETILIGGLMQDKVIESVVGLPLMRDIPLLGKLFKHTTRETVKTELVIMLTPRVLTDERIGAIAVSELEKFKELRE